MIKTTLLGITSAFLLLASAGLSEAQSFVGLGSTGTTLSFYSTSASGPTTVNVTGLNGGTSLVGIDYHLSSDQMLYGLATDGALYTLSSTGVATLSTSANFGGIPTAIDFNPVANRLRVFVGGNNFRLTPGTGVLTNDGAFAFAAGDVNAGATPNLAAAAYTNQFGGPSTTLYSIDAGLNALVLHTVGPAFSTLNTVATLTLNGLTFNAIAGQTGLDIFGGASFAYLTDNNNLYTVNLADGVMTSVGTFSGGLNFRDAAVVPEPSTSALIGLGLIVGFVAFRRRLAVARG